MPTTDLNTAPTALPFADIVRRALARPLGDPDVLVTERTRVGAVTRYAARLPRRHFYFGDGQARDRYDPLLFQEVVRQATRLMNVEFGVSRDDLIMERVMLQVPSVAALEIGAGDLELLIEESSKGRNHHITVHATLDDRPAFEAMMHGRSVPPAVYQRFRQPVRRPSSTPPAAPTLPARLCPPATVGRAAHTNVLIGEPLEGLAVPLFVDVTHPTLFTRPRDHVPGGALLEAGRQAVLRAALDRYALAPSHAVLLGWDAGFSGFVELDRPAVVTVDLGILNTTPTGAHSLLGTCTVSQDDRACTGIQFSVVYPRPNG